MLVQLFLTKNYEKINSKSYFSLKVPTELMSQLSDENTDKKGQENGIYEVGWWGDV